MIKLPINLNDLLHQRTIESERIEYKAGWNPEAVLHSICAFANDFHNLGGGYIVIGVSEENGFLKELDLTEGRSTGIPKILRVMKANGSPTPVFETDDDRSYFIICLAVHKDAQPEKTLQVTDQVKRLLSALESKPLSTKELMTDLGLSHRPTFFENYLQPAIDNDWISMTQPDSPRSPTQKYRLTKTGSSLLKHLISND
jgi:predicted HTH transcriptional regulator